MLCLPLLLMLTVVSLREIEAAFYNDSNRNARHGSCRFRMVRQIVDPPLGPPTTESFVFDHIEYKLCRYQVTWDEALVFCSSLQAQLATLDTEEKAAFVVQAIAASHTVAEDYWIGAKKHYRGPWIWNSNYKKLSSERNVISNTPVRYLGYEPIDVYCLTIDRTGHDVPIFIPRACNQRRPFICQRDNQQTYDNKMRMVAASRIGEQEFRLYSGRATWTEAVVQCRNEGLQIGEVNTIDEARALSVLMLRNRPEGIENAWIGGYTRKDDPNTWRWLASGERIENNDMWRKNLSEFSGGCLLLDRHVCETPIYVEAMCDRKRDVLCQKPPKKHVSKNLVAVFVDDCPYWIGFYPLQWSEAKRSCESMNATLVVLDSPKTITHMMSLMLDNRAELRHIWTDGKRTRNFAPWKWDSIGEKIDDTGKNFIPWCPDDGFYSNETNCLNLDRENYRTPLVYGLSCREKQSYICQPRVGECVFHSVPMLSSFPNLVTEDMTKTGSKIASSFYDDLGPLPFSKITAPYATSNNEIAIQTIIDKDNILPDSIKWKVDSTVNNSSTVKPNFTAYLKPFSEFTLPSLPQFGIKVVSAADSTPTSRPIFDSKRKKTKTHSPTTYSYGVQPPIFSSFPSTALPIGRKIPIDGNRKPFKWPQNSTRVSITSNPTENMGATVTSASIHNIGASVFSKLQHVSGTKKTSVGSKNSPSKLTNSLKVTTSASLLEESSPLSRSEDDRMNKHSIKTTRDLSASNSSRIVPTTTTTKIPETTKIEPSYSLQQSVNLSNLNDWTNTQRKPIAVPSFSVNVARPNATLVPRRKQKIRTTTESTPYDAIDADYYNNYDAVNEKILTGKETMDEEARDGGAASNEYSEDYDNVSPPKLQTKKTKPTVPSVRKNKKGEKSFRRMQIPKINEADGENDEESEETTRETVENSGKSTVSSQQTIPIAAELSKNLEAALVNMMKQGAEKRKNEKAKNAVMLKSAADGEGNISKLVNGNKNVNTENWSLRPYYAFEGPMIVGLTEDSNLGGEVEKTNENGRVREFKLIGKKINENSEMRKVETEKIIGDNDTRRQMKSQTDFSSTRNYGISMPDLPAIQPNDPNSLVQLGRYFKNKFVNFETSDGPQSVEGNGGEERKSSGNNLRDDHLNDQRRYGIHGSNARSRMRFRQRPGGREDEQRRRLHPGAWEKQRRLSQESDPDYYETRRLYPRGYNFYELSKPRRLERLNDEKWRESEQKRLSISWPDDNFTNYKVYDEQSQVVSPRTFSAPLRTTRSFHDNSEIRSNEPLRVKSFPDFKLSKLVKEVKIDLDQRLLRKYLEGFTRKIVRKDTTRVDDWKNTWRQLLGQMLTVLDRMNININGDLVKLRVGKDERDNKLVPSRSFQNSPRRKWKYGLRKQRKDSVNFEILKNPSYRGPKMNDSSTTAGEKLILDNRNHRVSPNSLLDKSSGKLKNPKSSEERTTQIYARYAYDDSVTKSPDKENIDHRKNDNSIADRKFVVNGSKIWSEHEEKTGRPMDRHFSSRRLNNDLQKTNWFSRKFTHFNNSRLVLAPTASMIPQISTVFGYQPVMPQLHHRILFPGWSGIRMIDRIKSASDKTAVLKGEYLPRGTLSRIVGSEHKKEHFGVRNDPIGNLSIKYDSRESMTPNSAIDNVVPTSPRDFEEINSNHENESPKIHLVADRERGQGSKSRQNDAWHFAEDVERKVHRGSYVNESDFRTIGNDRENIREENLDEDDARDDNNRKDYLQKRVWTPTHHLTKALELSLLRKFGTNPSGSLHTKNLVTRSTTNSEENLERTSHDGDYRKNDIEENLESLKEEPSIVSLRMIMDPDKNASPRTLRQSQDSRTLERKPRTVEVTVQFSGKEKAAGKDRKNENRITREGQRNLRKNGTFNFLGNNQNLKLRTVKRHPIDYIKNARRRALIARLCEKTRNLRSNYLRSYRRLERNETSMNNYRKKLSSRFHSPRERKSRTIVSGEKNLLKHQNSSKNYSGVKHHIATILRSFEEKNSRRKIERYAKDSSVDWTGQAASLFTDLKENNDEFTLYIDLTLGRVGSKTRNNRRSKG